MFHLIFLRKVLLRLWNRWLDSLQQFRVWLVPCLVSSEVRKSSGALEKKRRYACTLRRKLRQVPTRSQNLHLKSPSRLARCLFVHLTAMLRCLYVRSHSTHLKRPFSSTDTPASSDLTSPTGSESETSSAFNPFLWTAKCLTCVCLSLEH